jgi:hypothetical protein
MRQKSEVQCKSLQRKERKGEERAIDDFQPMRILQSYVLHLQSQFQLS